MHCQELAQQGLGGCGPGFSVIATRRTWNPSSQSSGAPAPEKLTMPFAETGGGQFQTVPAAPALTVPA